MSEQLFHLKIRPGISLQMQVQEMLVSLILDGHLAPGSALPSSRELARSLAVSRNTITLVYARLTDEGYLVSRARRGHFVNPGLSTQRAPRPSTDAAGRADALWERRLQRRPSRLPVLDKPRNWRECPYPFIYGQLDPAHFPAAEWRECARLATSTTAAREWMHDQYDGDDPLLVEQLRTRILPRRGIRCSDDNILVTLGTQHSLYLLRRLLAGPDVVVGVEDPGYVEARNNFADALARVQPLAVDASGLVIDDRSDACDLLYVTPSHQAPTTVTMPLARRQALLARAREREQLIIEDDYDIETRFDGSPTPALKSLDEDDRVVYIGSLSKTLAPGLRLGYIVGPTLLIREARALRRLMIRHAPTNNQRTLALFLAGGYHDSLVRRLTEVYRHRRTVLLDAMARWLPDVRISASDGGSALWCVGPDGLDAGRLQHRALARGVFIEAGASLFCNPEDGRHCFRMGFSAIDESRIEAGVRLLSEAREGGGTPRAPG